MRSANEILTDLDCLRDRRYVCQIGEDEYHEEWDRLWEELRATDRAEKKRQVEDRQARLSQRKVYCDGCCEGGVMGIGVYSEPLGIEIAEWLHERGTVNVAECRAVISALEECRRRGLSDVLLLSDSQLVVRWTSGSYQCRSNTARTYVPRIRELLTEIGGELHWISGKNNLADKYSRQFVCPLPRESLSPLQHVIQTPMEHLRFRDFQRLKCGRDEFSKVRLPKLIEQVGHDSYSAATAEFDDEKAVASCLRWVLRGLPIGKAVRKVKTDQEITENVREAKRHSRLEAEDRYEF